MEISVLVEPLNGQGYRATSLTPFRLVAEAITKEEAISSLRELVRGQLAQAEIVRLEVPVAGEDNPWRKVFGKLKDHPDAAEVEENIREFRRQRDADPNWS
jgi:hypothetical protein